MKNANYSNTWIDMEVPGSGYDLKIIRTYNSRSLFSGYFGFGWCSDFETRIEVNAEGNIKLTECGAGMEILYSPREVTKKDVDTTIAKIIAQMKAEKKVGRDDAFYKKLAIDLAEDADQRSKYSRQYRLIQSVKEGTAFYANGKEVESFVLNKNFYTRTLPDGTNQRFSLQGRLTHKYDKNGNFLKFDYDKDLVSQIEDNNGRRLSLKYYPNKKIKSISGPNGLLVEYKFANLDDLSWVNNAWKKVYTYEYDDLHNLVKATWPDKTSIVIKYDKKKDWVMQFQDRSKCVETYGYEFSTSDPENHYWSKVKKVCGKQVVADNKYEFWYKKRSDGESYLQRLLTNVNGSVTDISYHETFGRPVSIRKDNDRSTVEYYPNGQVKAKANVNSRLEYSYDAKSKKVSEVKTILYNNKGQKVSTRVSQFRYDAKGNLTFGQNSDGQKVAMTYDNKGRIASITDQAKKIVQIQYEDRYGKPAFVTRPGLGTIKVSYKANGQIDKAISPEGPSVAMQVASTFNNLLDVIAPATNEI
ncbi:MAG: DUF6531 domain-containing protein [Pseudobdellovibrionaceae bacterium]